MRKGSYTMVTCPLRLILAYPWKKLNLIGYNWLDSIDPVRETVTG